MEFNKTHCRVALGMLITKGKEQSESSGHNETKPEGGAESVTPNKLHAGKVNGMLVTLWAQSDVRANYMAALPEKTIKRRRLHKTNEQHALQG